MKITVNDIMSKRPCPDYPEGSVAKLWDGRPHRTLCQICDLDIPAEDRIWAVTNFLPDRERQLFAADCAESVLYLWTAEYPEDNRPALAIEAARKFAKGEVLREELDAARDAAWAAVRAAARDAARAAVRAAAWAAVRAAVRAATWDAAWAAARAAVRDATWDAAMAGEQKKQIAILRGYCAGLEK